MKSTTVSPSTFLMTLGLFLACLAPLSAQKVDHTAFGLKLGISGANLYDDAHADDRKSRIGLIGGAFVKAPLGNHFAVRPELLFSLKGGSFDFTDTTHSKVKLTYVELPISLEFNPISFLNLHAGLHAGYLLGANGSSSGGSILDFDKEDFQDLDYGWHAGAGLDLGNIGLQFRISRGLKDIGKGMSLDEVVGKLKNSAWSLSLSAAF